MNTASKWLQANLSDVIVAVPQANATLAGQTANAVEQQSTQAVDDADPDVSEFSWGQGLEPPLLRGKPPNEGGRYRGTSQLCEKHIAVSR